MASAYCAGQPYFAGFRSLASNGIDKPVLNVFRMFSRMNGRRLPAQSDAAQSVLKGVRAVAPPWHTQVTGQTAINSDSLSSLGRTMPIAIALIAIALHCN